MPITDWPVDRCPTFGCWRWQGRKDKDHYSRTQANELAYAVVYRQEVGAVPEGLFLDHLCRRRDCVAPYHLQPVTRRENVRRQQMRHRVKMRTCPHGHDLYLNGQTSEYGGRTCGYCSGVNPLRTT